MKKQLISHVLTLTICFCIIHIFLNSMNLSDAKKASAETTSSQACKHVSVKTCSTTNKAEFNVKTLNSSGEDKNSFVLAIMGDGFTQNEQETFNRQAQKLADHILATKPFSDAKDKSNIYAIDVISNQSGAAMDPSSPLDTYFGCSYNYSGIDRLLYYNKGNPEQVAKNHIPDYDFALLLVNSTKYGGSGGNVAVSSLNEAAPDLLLHEMGHTIGGLIDEYWYNGNEGPNMTQESSPEKVRWKEYLNEEGIGIYPYEEPEAAGWYRPSLHCKMKSLDEDFCAVCSATIAKQIDKYITEVASDSNSNQYDYYNKDDDYYNKDYDYYNKDDDYYNKDYDYYNKDYDYYNKDYDYYNKDDNYYNKDDDYSNTNTQEGNYSNGRTKPTRNPLKKIFQWFGSFL
jgi:hypothetical protein